MTFSFDFKDGSHLAPIPNHLPTMLRPLLLFLLCLSFVQSGIVAPTVSTTTVYISLVPVPIAPPIHVHDLSNTPNALSETCKDINGCRTLYSIVQSCLLMIFACVWVTVHRNIPGPQQQLLIVHLEWLKVVVLTLLIPEWILTWVVQRSLKARKLVTQLEEVRVNAKEQWEKRHEIRAAEMDGGRSSNEGEVEDSINKFGMVEREDEIPLTRCHPSRIDIRTTEAPGGDAPDTRKSVCHWCPFIVSI